MKILQLTVLTFITAYSTIIVAESGNPKTLADLTNSFSDMENLVKQTEKFQALGLKSMMAIIPPLSDYEVTNFSKTYPKMQETLKGFEKPNIPEEDLKAVYKSYMTGNPHQTMEELFPDHYIAAFDKVAIKNGYDDFSSYAQTADRIYSVVFSANFTKSMHDSFNKGDPGVGLSLFEYLEDKTIPLEKREKMEKQFNELCEKTNVFTKDIDTVKRHYGSLVSLLNLK